MLSGDRLSSPINTKEQHQQLHNKTGSANIVWHTCFPIYSTELPRKCSQMCACHVSNLRKRSFPTHLNKSIPYDLAFMYIKWEQMEKEVVISVISSISALDHNDFLNLWLLMQKG